MTDIINWQNLIDAEKRGEFKVTCSFYLDWLEDGPV